MSVIPPVFALINQSSEYTSADLADVAAAIQKGVNRDFAPIWKAPATVAVPKRIPHGAIPVYIKDGLDEPGAAGYHTDEHNQPVIYVDASVGDLSLTIDHEVKETLADPFGNRLVPMTLHHKRVQVLVEVCDPPEDPSRAYPVDGLPVSDFVLPAFYGPAHHGVRTCFHGDSLRPGYIDRGGYISYVDAEDVWHQDTWFGGPSPAHNVLGLITEFGRPGEMLRESIDRVTYTHAVFS